MTDIIKPTRRRLLSLAPAAGLATVAPGIVENADASFDFVPRPGPYEGAMQEWADKWNAWMRFSEAFRVKPLYLELEGFDHRAKAMSVNDAVARAFALGADRASVDGHWPYVWFLRPTLVSEGLA